MAKKKLPDMWARLVGQDAAVHALRDAVATGKFGHAYLFAGPEGVGRELAAIALAASLNCDDGGCGTCDVCARILRRAHPDVTRIQPQGAQILVEQVRDLRLAAHRTPVEGRVKVFLIEDAHRLNPAAANALLKVLEEPPGDVVFVLVTNSPEDLLPTIVSRCRRVDFYALGPRQIEQVLIDHHGIEPSAAAWAARAGGDLSRALGLSKDPEGPARREAHVEIPGRLVRGGPGEAVRIARELTEEAGRAREASTAQHRAEIDALTESFGDARGSAAARKRLEERHKRELRRRETEAYDSALRDIGSFFRDVLLLGAGAPEDVLVNAEIGSRLRRAAEVADPAWLARAIDRIESVRRAIGRSAQPTLALEALFMELGMPRARTAAR